MFSPIGLMVYTIEVSFADPMVVASASYGYPGPIEVGCVVSLVLVFMMWTILGFLFLLNLLRWLQFMSLQFLHL